MEPAHDVLKKASRVKLVVFDVDGVLTDGTLYLGDDGQEYKAFHTRDGLGMRMLKGSGVEIGIITGRSSGVVQRRMASLGIEHVFQGQKEKLPVFDKLIQKLGIGRESAAYVGDDIVDIPVMQCAGLAIAVADAHPLVLKHAHWRTLNPGGHGAVRDVCDLVMQGCGTLDRQYSRYLVAG
ncbi:MAG: 3-deoxy-manno-octulosonate-8-phosphatase KdsC [Gammaproteobacteria bacterium]|nr:3-deoxy-manno-octulosonate-8-phosphatase KdsC [Gammaproteobacteria bacterium]